MWMINASDRRPEPRFLAPERHQLKSRPANQDDLVAVDQFAADMPGCTLYGPVRKPRDPDRHPHSPRKATPPPWRTGEFEWEPKPRRRSTSYAPRPPSG